MKTAIDIVFDTRARAFYAEVREEVSGRTLHQTERFPTGDQARRAAIAWRREVEKQKQAK